MLASGRTGKQAADALGLTPKTLCQWNARPDFRALVEQLLSETQSEAVRALSGLSRRAVERLADLLESKIDGSAQRAIETVLGRQSGYRSHACPSAAGDTWTAIIERFSAHEAEKPQKPH
jgi:hypothetical protein